MTRLQARFKTIVARYGDPLGSAPAVLAPLAPSKARTYVGDADLGSASRPIWIATTGYDHPAAEGDTLAWGARSLTVKKAVDVRFAGKSVARLLVLFPASSGGGGAGGGGTTPETGF